VNRCRAATLGGFGDRPRERRAASSSFIYGGTALKQERADLQTQKANRAGRSGSFAATPLPQAPSAQLPEQQRSENIVCDIGDDRRMRIADDRRKPLATPRSCDRIRRSPPR
jgi:hypothetical protein